MAKPGPKRKAPPTHLSPSARELWRRLFDTYQIDLAGGLVLLDALCEAWDQARRCREALAGETSMVVTDKAGGLRIHPLAIEARNCREQVGRLARLLKIHSGEEEGSGDAP